ncbi:MAG: type 12 methyltransferase [Puniceicoccaceae bacterium 5H]|nr:MAG: type 12 methyltransferase [Puniceicoccaceae bacterium 5H]
MQTVPPEYFERKYRRTADPWSFATSEYEDRKYAHTLTALPREHYPQAFEVGCSVGVLTARLAPRCGELLAVDVSPLAVEQAQERCRRFPHVTCQTAQLPKDFPSQRFDLIVLSEVGYYFSWGDLAEVRRSIRQQLAPGGHLLLVHWIHAVEDYPLTGDEVHTFFLEDDAFAPLQGERREHYRLDLLERAREA